MFVTNTGHEIPISFVHKEHLICYVHLNTFQIYIGKIACANVLSDLYAMGVTECDNMLMLLGVSTKMTEKERDVVIPLIMRGFKDAALEAGTTVTGGQTVVNPWCTIGGVASTVCQPNEYIVPDNAVVGDVLVLTKPLGTQVLLIFIIVAKIIIILGL